MSRNNGNAIIQRVTTVAVGTPPANYSYSNHQKIVEVHFHGFEDLPSDRGAKTMSPTFTCLGREWRLAIFPGGDDYSDEGYMAVYLYHLSPGTVCISSDFRVCDREDGETVAYGYAHNSRCFPIEEREFVKRSTIVERALGYDNTLIIQVKMKLIEATDTPVAAFVPNNPIRKIILGKFMDENTADIVIEVGTNERVRGRGAAKRAKTAPVTFYAHHLILQDGAPTLAELCKSSKNKSPIHIKDVKPHIFRHMLYYIYGGKVPEEDLNANAKDIIEAADEYGVVGLKLLAEACYASSTKLTTDNVLDNLLYADAKNCALLKEVVMDYIVENGKSILASVSFEDVPGAMLTDLLTAMTRGKEKDQVRSGGFGRIIHNNNFDTMRVSTLRKKLHEKGLDIDGSRETMIALLKENS